MARHPASSAAADTTEKMPRPESFEPRSGTAEPPAGRRRRGMAAWVGLPTAALLAGASGWMLMGAEPAQPVPEEKLRATVAVPPLEDQARRALEVVSGSKPPTVKRAGPAASVDRANSLPLAVFPEVKLLSVDGRRTATKDVVLALSGAEISALSAENHEPLATVPYARIARATYVHAGNPRWHPQASAPAGQIDVPGILGRARHWLVLQTNDSYTILRLDGPARLEILKALEGRSGRTIDRPIGAEK